ncbi:MAG: hypothetical protein LBN94_00975 [Puniceicoccales bacterium]|nr:hypothetical protein [Puniceicoccales bacterium]
MSAKSNVDAVSFPSREVAGMEQSAFKKPEADDPRGTWMSAYNDENNRLTQRAEWEIKQFFNAPSPTELEIPEMSFDEAKMFLGFDEGETRASVQIHGDLLSNALSRFCNQYSNEQIYAGKSAALPEEMKQKKDYMEQKIRQAIHIVGQNPDAPKPIPAPRPSFD